MGDIIILKFAGEPAYLEKPIGRKFLCDALPSFNKILEDSNSTVITIKEDYHIFAKVLDLACKKHERERIISMGKRYGVDLTDEIQYQ